MDNVNECESFVKHIVAEHRRLNAVLHRADQIISEQIRNECGTWNDVANLLQSIRDELQSHFQEEERGGCLEEAVSRCPSVSDTVSRIESEHRDLLLELDRLIAMTHQFGTADCNRTVFATAFAAFLRRLRAHEAAESRVLRRAFGVNVNGDE